MEGVFVRDRLFKFDSDEIVLGNELTDNDVKDLLEALIQGKFTRVKKIQAVSFFWTCWFLVPLEGDAFYTVTTTWVVRCFRRAPSPGAEDEQHSERALSGRLAWLLLLLWVAMFNALSAQPLAPHCIGDD